MINHRSIWKEKSLCGHENYGWNLGLNLGIYGDIPCMWRLMKAIYDMAFLMWQTRYSLHVEFQILLNN
jgi:hypothetical protein